MKRILIIILFLIIIAGCSDPIEKIIPPEALKGALTNLDTTEDIWKKSVKGGKFIDSLAEVPYDIKREQLRPTLLNGIQSIKKQHPTCEWIVFCLRPGKSKGTGIYAGRAEYKEGEMTLWYGIPSKKQLAASAELKKEYSNPSLKGKTGVFGLDLYDPNYESVRPLNKHEFDLGVRICVLYYKTAEIINDKDNKAAIKNKEWNSDLYGQLMATSEERIFKSVADELKMPVAEILKIKSRIKRYYDHIAWGKETIK